MRKPIKMIFKDTSDQFCTEGETYEVLSRGKAWMVLKDDEGDHHGLSDRQLKKWFYPAEHKQVNHPPADTPIQHTPASKGDWEGGQS